MKYFIFIYLIVSCFINIASAQGGELQFNRTIYREFDISHAGSTAQGYISGGSQYAPSIASIALVDTIILVVANGKTFKLERASGTQLLGAWNCGTPITYTQPNTISGNGGSPLRVLMNGNIIYDYSPMYGNYGITNGFPIWLSEGTYIFSISGGSNYNSNVPCTNTYPYTYVYPPARVIGFISGIEFNIIP